MTSRGKFLVSVGADGKTVVYDFAKHEAEREMNVSDAAVGAVKDLIVMEDENTIVLADEKGLHSIDIEESTSAEECYAQGSVN